MKSSLLFFAITIFGTLHANAQECGTIATAEDIKVLTEFNEARIAGRAVQNSYPRINIALTIHIVRQDDGTGGLSTEEFEQALGMLNEAYDPINFHFFVNGDIRYIDDTDYFNFDSSNETQLTSANNVSQNINIYFFNSLTSGGSNLCGYAYFPSTGRDHIMMANGCAATSTLAHEVGHYFALYHTHGKTNTGTTDELVDGSNCETTGDDVCDTPADPNLSGVVNGGDCSYFGDNKDSNGDEFSPFPKNFMSYSISGCREQFTQGQYDRVVDAFNTFKTYLDVDKLSPDFNLTTRYICEGDEVFFDNSSLDNYTSVSWEFEGGTPSISSNIDETVTYVSSGSFDVKLVLTDSEGGTEELLLVDYVIVEGTTDVDEGSITGSFEDSTFEETILNEDDKVTFEITSRASTDENSAAIIDLYSYREIGQEDYIILSKRNTSEDKFYQIEFDYAYATYGSSNDGLALVYRETCGNWVTFWEKYGDDLATAGDIRSYFVPDDDQWTRETVQVEIPTEINEVEFAVKSINDFGNNIYIDNYRIQDYDPTFTIDDVVVTNSTCDDSVDGQIEIVASGEGTFKYSINEEDYVVSNLFQDLAPGEYLIKVKKDENESVKDRVVEVSFSNVTPEKPEISLIGDFLQTSAGSGQTIQWYLDGEIIVGESAGSISNLVSGAYQVELSSGGCSAISDPFIVLSTEEIRDGLQLYPNPAKDVMYFSLTDRSATLVKVEIVNSAGKLMHQMSTNSIIDVSKLSSGIYFVRVVTNDKIYLERLIKK